MLNIYIISLVIVNRFGRLTLGFDGDKADPF